jgi:hypothetical protein
MSVLNKLASAMNQRDEGPNIALAEKIASKNDEQAVQELVENLNNKSSAIQSDCIKVLYETGERKPQLIVPYIETFVKALNHKNNRIQWGAMTALDAISSIAPEKVHKHLSSILKAADSGSVIMRDHAVQILVKLCSTAKYYKDAFPLLMEQLQVCPSNQLPMYAENAMSVINTGDKEKFVAVLQLRMGDMEKESKRKRVGKVLKKISQ